MIKFFRGFYVLYYMILYDGNVSKQTMIVIYQRGKKLCDDPKFHVYKLHPENQLVDERV